MKKQTTSRTTIVLPEGTKEFTLREGIAIDPNAPDQKPRKHMITGTIEAPRAYMEKREVDKKKALVIINDNMEKSKILLIVDQLNHYSDEITGKIELHPMFQELPVNSGKSFTHEQLRDWVKSNAHVFVTHDEYVNFLQELGKFKAKVDQAIEHEKNERGSFKTHIEKHVETNMRTDFKLNVPLLKGGEKKIFSANICITHANNACIFTLESPVLRQMILDEIETRISKERKYFEEKELCIIYEVGSK